MIIHLIAKFAHTRIITFVSPKYQINNSYQILDNKKKKTKNISCPLWLNHFMNVLFYLQIRSDIDFWMRSIILLRWKWFKVLTHLILRHERSFSSFKDSLKQTFSQDKIAQTDSSRRTQRFIQKFAKYFSFLEHRVMHIGKYLVEPGNLSNNYLS